MTAYILSWFFIVLATCVSCYLYYLAATRLQIVAKVNLRSAHKDPTPTGAGIVLCVLFLILAVLGMLLDSISIDLGLACLGPVFLGILGYLDDHIDLSSAIRAPLFIFAASWCVYWLGVPNIPLLQPMMVKVGILSALFMVLLLFWIQNLYNFMDGIDGIAAAQMLFVCLGGILVSDSLGSELMLLLMAVSALSLGFLILNWPQAKLFMGDAGSGFFGLMLGVLILEGGLSIWVWLILLSQFISDSSQTIFIRILRREKIYVAHSLHAYQHLNRRIGTLPTLLLSIATNVIWVLPLAYLGARFESLSIYIFLIVLGPLLIRDYMLGAGRKTI